MSGRFAQPETFMARRIATSILSRLDEMYAPTHKVKRDRECLTLAVGAAIGIKAAMGVDTADYRAAELFAYMVAVRGEEMVQEMAKARLQESPDDDEDDPRHNPLWRG